MKERIHADPLAAQRLF